MELHVEAKRQADEIMDFRWRQSEEMKDYVQSKAREAKVLELEESRDFQEFKREARATVKEDAKRLISQEYMQATENAAWRLEKARVAAQKEKELAFERVQHVQEARHSRLAQVANQKREDEEERRFEEYLEMSHIAKQLEKENKALLQSLEFTRACQKKIVRGF